MTHQLDFELFRNNLKILRSAHGMTARELSAKADLAQMKRISDIEDGRGKPTLEEVYVVSIIFNTPIDKLLFSELRITIQ